jgi:hypothetical protein
MTEKLPPGMYYLLNDPNRLDVYRRPFSGFVGEETAVTITEEQCSAIKHAARVWVKIAEKENYSALADVKKVSDALNSVTLFKSCLMGRMLYQGKAPLKDKPPVVNGAPAYWLVDPLLCPNCMEPRTGPAGHISASIKPDPQLEQMAVNAGRKLGKTFTVTYCGEDWHRGRAL